MRRPLPVVFTLLVTSFLSSRADAFCRTWTCDPGSESCPTDDKGCVAGDPKKHHMLSWANPCVSFSLNQAASKQVPFDTFKAVADASFARWSSVDCSGAPPSITFTDFGAVSATQHAYREDAGNVNLIVFRDEQWPYTNATNTLGLTTLTFNLDTGEIYDGDMEINGTSKIVLTTGDTGVKVDLASVITHEAGHFLGLGHSLDKTATMYAAYTPGTVTLRDLEADDVAGVCEIYPPSAANRATCDPTPRHGYDPTGTAAPAEKEDKKGCGCRLPGGEPPAGGWGLGLGLIAAGVVAAGRRRRRRLCCFSVWRNVESICFLLQGRCP